jgi:hypothetical protein
LQLHGIYSVFALSWTTKKSNWEQNQRNSSYNLMLS